VLDLKNVIYMDSSGVDGLMALADTCRKAHLRLLICGLAHQPLDIAVRSGLQKGLKGDAEFADLASALAAAQQTGN
jgi:sulfate permease, SulP family